MFSKVQLNSNINLTLDQRCKDETFDAIKKMTQQDSFHVNFYEPRQGNIDGFSRLESLKKTKR
jgi:hypothetical protein